jgi:ABC-type lipoprotein release transport system permease subunit
LDEKTGKTIFTTMRARRKQINMARYISCIFMMLALAWLTISLPVVYSAQENLQEKTSKNQQTAQDEESDNPLTNTTEEKTPAGSNSFSEEYLHDSNHTEHFTTELSFKYHIEHNSTYIAFYGDLETPPPDQA